MTDKKQTNSAEEKTEDSRAPKNSFLETLGNLFYAPASKNYSDAIKEQRNYSRNNSFKNYNSSFYSLSV